MVICDRCRSENSVKLVKVDTEGIDRQSINRSGYIQLNWSTDLCTSCQTELLDLLKVYYKTNPKEPKSEPRTWPKEQIYEAIKDTWERQSISGDINIFVNGVFDELF